LGGRRCAGSLAETGGQTAPVAREHPERSLSEFTVEAAAAMAGPDWLRARRIAAAERAAGGILPSAEEEVWRYSRIDELDLDAHRPVPAELTVSAPPGTDRVRVGPASRVSGAEQLLGMVAGAATDLLSELNDAFAEDPVVVDVDPGAHLDGPIVISVRGAADGEATFPRLLVRVGEEATVSVIERHEGGGAGLVVPITEIAAAAGARVGHVVVQDLDRQTWSIGRLAATADAGAVVSSGTAAFGGAYARLRTDCRLTGRGAKGELLAAFFGDGDQTLDFRTFQDHIGADTTSDLLFKGALAGRSRSVYTGLIHVGKDARGTNAFQTNRNLKLSDDAWAESVPNLEIENNDVRCSHASTVSPVDAEQRFYLESRGVPTQEAERLIVAGFFDDVLRRMPAGGLLDDLRARVASKLDGTRS
jgi:Fe-S cluster assembly protein SufD